MTTTVGDLLAAMDVIDALGEESDQLPLKDALALHEALGLLGSVLKRTQSLVQTQALRLLEQPTVVGNRRYKRKPRFVKRFDHYKIGRMVADRSMVDRETGEIFPVREAVDTAVRMLIQLYLSESSSAKLGELKRLLGVNDPIEENVMMEVGTGMELGIYELEGLSDVQTPKQLG